MPSQKQTKKISKQDDRRSLLDIHKKEEMLAVLIRNPSAYVIVNELLLAEHVAEIGQGHALIWEVVRQFHDQFKKLPAKEQLNSELHQRLSADEELLSDEEKEAVDEFVEYAFDKRQHGVNIAKSKQHRDHAIQTCRLLLEEYAAVRLRKAMLADGTVPVDMRAALEDVQSTISRAASLTTPSIETVFDDGWEQEADLALVPCGVKAVDRLIGGGGGAGEVIIFMGPQGSCKSTLAVQIAANLAKHGADIYLSGLFPKGKRPVSVVVSTEMELKEFRLRVLAYLAKIPQQRLRKLLAAKNLEGFSRDPKPAMTKGTAYEKKQFQSQYDEGKGFVCEYDRIGLATQLVNQFCMFVNATPNNALNPNLGKGGVAEIAAVLEAHIRQHPEVKPINLVLDHASALASRMVGYDGVTTEDLRHILRDIPLHVRDMIAVKYQIPTYVMHQLSGEAARRGPTADYHHTDAAECKQFAEFASFAIVSGPPTDDGRQLARFRCTKHRREPPKPYSTVEIRGSFNEVVDRTGDIFVDQQRRIFVTKEELKSFGYAKKHNDFDVDEKSGSVSPPGMSG